MNQYSIDTKIKNGHLEINNIPLPNNSEVKVIIIPKSNLKKLHKDLLRARDLTKSIKSDVSRQISIEREHS